MFDLGLGVTYHVPTFRRETSDVEYDVISRVEAGQTIQQRTLCTPVGQVDELYVDGWRQEHYLKTAQDYRVMTYVVRHTEIVPAYDSFWDVHRQVVPFGIPLAVTGRTPLQTILVDCVGVERFGYHIYDLETELLELYDALLDLYRRIIYIVAEGPGRFVSVLENFAAETLGPARYEQFLLPVYNELFPLLRCAGKIVGTHYDGQLASCSHLIEKAPIDLIESLTPPPEGDMTLAECRQAWPEKLFWSNINVSDYDLPPDDLRALVLQRVEEAAPDGRRLAFEISEQYPHNWRESVPVVLEALMETRL